jgi:transposase InsO family protein
VLALEMDIKIKTPKGKRALRALLDSGARANLISQRVIVEEGMQPLTMSPRAYSIDGHRIRTYGRHAIETHASDTGGVHRSTTQKYIATDMLVYDAILGYPWLTDANPDPWWRTGEWYYREGEISIQMAKSEDFDESEPTVAIMLVACPSPLHCVPEGIGVYAVDTGEISLPPEYECRRRVFSEEEATQFPGHTTVRHSIEIEPGQKVPYGPIYPLSANELRVLREYLDTHLARGWIRESDSEAGAPILFVAKKDGSLRLCVDYRALNKITRKNRYPLPLIGETLDRLSGSTIFTKLDLRDAYHRIPIEEADRWKTAFRTRYGHFEYTVMPFGLTNAPATFQAYINEALRGLLDDICVAYMDDIMIFSRSREEHTAHVLLVLERLEQYQLFVKLSKCEFSTTEVDFLGYRIGVTGVSMDSSRVEAIRDWPVPTSFRDVQVFLGFANFYRGFIFRYSAVVAPITDLLVGMEKGKKSGPFVWTDLASQAFSTLKDCFMNAPMLTHFDPDIAHQVATDASGGAVGGILSQACETLERRTVWKPVAFFSKKMTKEQRNYSTGDQEMFAIVYAFKVWRHYLEAPAISTIVYTDHETLQSFMTTKTLNRRQARWAEALARFDFVIRYRKGKDNPADGLSRRPDHMQVEEEDRENSLGELLRLRLSTADDSQPDHLRDAVDTMIGAVTRTKTRESRDPQKSPLNTLVQQGVLPKPREEGTNGTELQASTQDAGDALATKLRTLQDHDEWCQKREWSTLPNGKVTSGPFRGTWSVDHASIVRRDGAAYVPNDPWTRGEILRVNHDDPWQGGHFGRARTQETIMRVYWWPHIRKDIIDYVETCDVCQRMKVPRHKPYGLLAPLPQPEKPWQDISLDFIVGLPPSARRGSAYDSIFVVVDRYSKMARFIACNNTIDAKELGNLLIEEIFSKYGVPRSIVSDRGTTFTSQYYGTFCYYLAVRRRFSTAFHPQTDGQTERMNQTLECYLRCYVNYQQDDWCTLLASAEYASNRSINSSTGKSPFELVYRFVPSMRMNLDRESQSDEHKTAKQRLEVLAEATQENETLRRESQEKVSRYYNKNRKDMSYAEGDLVLLASRHIRTLRASKKLADKFLGPFKILARIGPNAYKLDLPPKYGRLHHTFHVSLLEAYRQRDGCDPPEPQDIDGEEEWEVDKILDEKRSAGKRYFYIRWKGFSEAHDSWEPESNLLHAREAIATFTRKE